MGKKLFVGNLPFSATEEGIASVFAECGAVESVKIIMDRDTGRSKGFAFVEMGSDGDAATAIQKLNGVDHGGRNMIVSEARPMAPRGDRPSRGGFDDRPRGGGGRDGGGRGRF
ncbi:MAG: RNA-binding protein [Bdellovibrionales bacterium]|nr:RNA-binding protein [Bdellovibrionales bacterium]